MHGREAKQARIVKTASIKYFFSLLVLIHGLIHLIGFAKAFGYPELQQLTKEISKPMGFVWLVVAVCFVVASVYFIAGNNLWMGWALFASCCSQFLIFVAWHDAKYGSIANLVILTVSFFNLAALRFENKFLIDVKNNFTHEIKKNENVLSEEDIVKLPPVIKKYLHYSGCIGKPKVSNIKVKFSGRIRKNEKSEWMPFTSVQYNFIDSAARLFFMKATMNRLPVAGYHCYKRGDAFMDIRLLSTIKVQEQSGKEMGIAETVTFFNDMCCMAPATLIDKRIKWLYADAVKAIAEFTVNNISINAELFFNDEGALVNFISDDRYATTENGTMGKLKWSTPINNYTNINGHMVVKNADAIYTYPEGDLCYGQFVTEWVEYNCKTINE